MERYKRKKVKAKHAYYEMSSCEKCITHNINYLKEVKRGLIFGSAFTGALSLIGLSSIVLVKDNNLGQISFDISISACFAVISICCAHDLKGTSKQLKILKERKLWLKISAAKDVSNNDDDFNDKETAQNVYTLK